MGFRHIIKGVFIHQGNGNSVGQYLCYVPALIGKDPEGGIGSGGNPNLSFGADPAAVAGGRIRACMPFRVKYRGRDGMGIHRVFRETNLQAVGFRHIIKGVFIHHGNGNSICQYLRNMPAGFRQDAEGRVITPGKDHLALRRDLPPISLRLAGAFMTLRRQHSGRNGMGFRNLSAEVGLNAVTFMYIGKCKEVPDTDRQSIHQHGGNIVARLWCDGKGNVIVVGHRNVTCRADVTQPFASFSNGGGNGVGHHGVRTESRLNGVIPGNGVEDIAVCCPHRNVIHHDLFNVGVWMGGNEHFQV